MTIIKKRFSTVLSHIQAIMTVLLSLLSLSSRFACNGHSLRTRRRGDARKTTGCKKNKFKFVHSAYNLVHCTWYVYFRAIPSLSAPAWAPGQPDTTPGPIPSDDRGTGVVRHAWELGQPVQRGPQEHPDPAPCDGSGALEPLFPPFPAESARPMCH